MSLEQLFGYFALAIIFPLTLPLQVFPSLGPFVSDFLHGVFPPLGNLLDIFRCNTPPFFLVCP